MIAEDELETHLDRVHLDYRRHWLDAEDTLGLVAQTLAAALHWQPTHESALPDALELAELAATHIATLERLTATTKHRAPRQASPPRERAQVT